MNSLPLKRLLIFGLGFFIIFDLVLVGIYFRKTSRLNFLPFLGKRPGSCLVVEEKHCQKGEPIYKEDKLVFIGFKLPKNTPIFTPLDGGFSNTRTFFVKKGDDYVTYPGIAVNVIGEDGKHTKISFSAAYYDLEETNEPFSYEVKKGEIISKVSEKILSEYGDYNLLVTFSEFNQEKKMLSVDEDFLKDLFKL